MNESEDLLWKSCILKCACVLIMEAAIAYPEAVSFFRLPFSAFEFLASLRKTKNSQHFLLHCRYYFVFFIFHFRCFLRCFHFIQSSKETVCIHHFGRSERSYFFRSLSHWNSTQKSRRISSCNPKSEWARVLNTVVIAWKLNKSVY